MESNNSLSAESNNGHLSKPPLKDSAGKFVLRLGCVVFLIMGHRNGSTTGHMSFRREVCSYVYVRVSCWVHINIG